MTTNTTIAPELLDQLLANYERPEDLTGDGGLFKQLKKALIERALGAELTDHLGYEKGDPAVEASAGRYGEAAAALREMPTWNYPPGMLEAAATVLDSAPTKAAALAALPRLGNMSFAYMHVGAPERVLEFYEDEIAGRYFQPISTTWFWHPTYAAVRRTERFKNVARGLGLVDYWCERGWPAQCHPLDAEDFACE